MVNLGMGSSRLYPRLHFGCCHYTPVTAFKVAQEWVGALSVCRMGTPVSIQNYGFTDSNVAGWEFPVFLKLSGVLCPRQFLSTEKAG